MFQNQTPCEGLTPRLKTDMLCRMNNAGVVPPLCSVVDAAELLGIPLSTAQRWARTGRLPVITKLSGSKGAYVLDRDEIESLAAQRKVN